MKKSGLFILPLLAFGFASCSDDDSVVDEPTVCPMVVCDVITFEDCEFSEGKNSNWTGGNTTGEYTELGVTFKYADKYSYSSGCVVSSIHSIPEDESEKPPTHGVALSEKVEHPGATNSDKFLVVCNNTYVPDARPEFAFDEGVERKIVSADLMNSAMMYQYMLWGFYSNPGMKTGDWCKVTLTGYDATGAETSSVEYFLGDYNSKQDFILDEWTTVDLTALGSVNKVEVIVSWSESWDCPSYGAWAVCLDNIKFEKVDE